jgi:hypothetical protein
MTARSNPSASSIRPAIERARLQALSEGLQGHAFTPGDDGYDAARQTWNATTFDQRPAVVVMPAEPSDVIAAFYMIAMAAGMTPEQVERGKQSVMAMMGALKAAMTGEILINALALTNAFTPSVDGRNFDVLVSS